jgi:hypothetical protein
MDADARADAESGARRSDRWAAEPAGSGVNWWAILGVLAVLAGYAAAALVVAVVKETVRMGDDAALALFGATPALGALGMTLGLVGRRREGVHWLAWLAIVLGAVLVLASLAAIVAVTVAFRTLG